MVRNNNALSTGHYHKYWQQFIRTDFDGPSRKARRYRVRDRKARILAPGPIDKLRPVVRCPTARYNAKPRQGRGFSLAELRAAKIHPKYARSVGIAVDHRRRNKSLEGLSTNVARLKAYTNRLVLLPRSDKARRERPAQEFAGTVNDPVPGQRFDIARVVEASEKKFEAYVTLRKARSQRRVLKNKNKKARAAQLVV